MDNRQRLPMPEGERKALIRMIQDESTDPVIARRAQYLVRRAQGFTTIQVAKEFGVSVSTVNTWVDRYLNRPEHYDLVDLLTSNISAKMSRPVDDEARRWLWAYVETYTAQPGYNSRRLADQLRVDCVGKGYPQFASISWKKIETMMQAILQGTERIDPM